jgi:branched-chain amino acid transport system substrate-binding protein
LIFYDDGSDTKQAVSFARKLIDQDKVDVLIGGSLVGPTLAMMPLAEEAEVPMMAQPGAVSIIEPIRKWVFLFSHTDRMGLEKVFSDMQKRKITKIGLIAGSRGFDASCRPNAQAMAPKFGISILDDEVYAPTDTDVTPQLVRLREHKDIQAVLSCGSQAPTVITVHNYRQLGIKLPLYFTLTVITPTFLQSVGTEGEGIRAISTGLPIAEQLPANHPQKRLLLDQTMAYEAAYHQPIVLYAAHVVDALMAYSIAVKKVGNTKDKDEIRNQIEQIKNMVGVNGIFNFSPTDHNGLSIRDLHVVEVRNGKFKMLD